jgi:hypothetical protein
MQQSKQIEKTAKPKFSDYLDLVMQREERKRQEEKQRNAARQAKQALFAC